MMYQFRRTVGGVASALLLSGVLAGPAVLEAQRTVPGPEGRWPLQPLSADNHILAPFMEGWYANEDGTYTISFGYSNSNLDTLYIPIGENNSIEPAQFSGMQPTVFFPGHHRGIFAVTLPANMKDTDVWWRLRKANGDSTKVPGRTSSIAYQLDWLPRPHGGLPPSVSFEGQSGVGRGPPGIMLERMETVAVGSPLTLSVNVMDPSQRNPEDFRAQDVPVRVVWSQLQGPGPVAFTRHPSNALPEAQAGGRGAGGAGAGGGFFGRGGRGGPQTINVEGGEGTASVIVTFPTPGEYIIRARADNFSAPDSADNDNCCFTNGYVRVNVTP